MTFTGMYFTLSNQQPIVQPGCLVSIETSRLSDFIAVFKNIYKVLTELRPVYSELFSS